MKLELKKQQVISLSDAEMNEVSGGGMARSTRLNGGCAYSRKYRHQNTCGNTIGCHTKDHGLCQITVSG